MIRTPFDTLAEYERRSLAHAVAQPAREIAQDQYRGVGYRVGKRRLISNFGEVVEIVPMPPVTPVPGAQPWLLGIGNLRGNLFPVVDLKQFLEGERQALGEGAGQVNGHPLGHTLCVHTRQDGVAQIDGGAQHALGGQCADGFSRHSHGSDG